MAVRGAEGCGGGELEVYVRMTRGRRVIRVDGFQEVRLRTAMSKLKEDLKLINS